MSFRPIQTPPNASETINAHARMSIITFLWNILKVKEDKMSYVKCIQVNIWVEIKKVAIKIKGNLRCFYATQSIEWSYIFNLISLF